MRKIACIFGLLTALAGCGGSDNTGGPAGLVVPGHYSIMNQNCKAVTFIDATVIGLLKTIISNGKTVEIYNTKDANNKNSLIAYNPDNDDFMLCYQDHWDGDPESCDGGCSGTLKDTGEADLVCDDPVVIPNLPANVPILCAVQYQKD